MTKGGQKWKNEEWVYKFKYGFKCLKLREEEGKGIDKGELEMGQQWVARLLPIRFLLYKVERERQDNCDEG